MWKKIVLISSVSLFASSSIFTGKWCVQEEGISLNFVNDSSVSFKSDDETINGEGIYSYSDTTLRATINSSDMIIDIEYSYRVTDSIVEVKTESMLINSEAIENSDEWFSLVKCDSSVEIEDKEK